MAIDHAIQKLAGHSDMKYASLGVCLVDVATNKVIASHNPDLSVIPASTMKVITTATALSILGPDYQFKTELLYDGAIENGVLKGNLYIKGYGDPTLGSDQLAEMGGMDPILEAFANAIKEKGIKQIEGKIVGDGTHFESSVSGESWAWNDIGNYYGAGVSGLNFHENLYHLTFKLGSNLNSPPTIKSVKPTVPNLFFINELTSGEKNSGDNAYIYGAPRTYERFIRGTLPIGKEYTIKGAIPDPAYFMAHSLHAYLREKHRIKTPGLTTTQLEMDRANNSPKGTNKTTIYTHQSPKLTKIVDRAVKKSVNLYCESLLKAIGVKQSGKGTSLAGIEAIQTFWEERGVKTDGWFMEDGSGLSPRNSITAKKLATILAKVEKDKIKFANFRSYISTAKQYGTLKGARNPENVWMKSGSMGRVRGYSGYIKTKKGQLLAYALLANNYQGKGSTMSLRLKELLTTISNEN